MELLKSYWERNDLERHIIAKAYEFEVDAIENESYAFNPYLKRVKEMGLLEALEEALHMRYA